MKKFLKDWMLVIGMVTGVSVYLIYNSIDSIHSAGPFLYSTITGIQPVLLFMMLFLTFSRIEPRQLRPKLWMLWLLLIQVLSFAALSLMVIKLFPYGESSRAARVVVESAMLCLICPTATACSVVTGKLGGSMASVVTYTALINIAVSLAVPALVPFLYPVEGASFLASFVTILAKVFPLLICPCLLAWLVRYFMPRLHSWVASGTEAAFYLWAVSLVLAIIVATRSIVHSGLRLQVLAGIAGASLLSCAFQFWSGKKIGGRYGESISAGQALGQKNTVFAIWMGYTFLDPVTSIAGGFYTIWHNCFNTWQLIRKNKQGFSPKK